MSRWRCFSALTDPCGSTCTPSHFRRIAVSYAVIPLAVTAALLWNGRARLVLVIGGSAVLAAIKLVLTAGLLVAIAIAG